jgi:hypothetical protein
MVLYGILVALLLLVWMAAFWLADGVAPTSRLRMHRRARSHREIAAESDLAVRTESGQRSRAERT